MFIHVFKKKKKKRRNQRTPDDEDNGKRPTNHHHSAQLLHIIATISVKMLFNFPKKKKIIDKSHFRSCKSNRFMGYWYQPYEANEVPSQDAMETVFESKMWLWCTTILMVTQRCSVFEAFITFCTLILLGRHMRQHVLGKVPFLSKGFLTCTTHERCSCTTILCVLLQVHDTNMALGACLLLFMCFFMFGQIGSGEVSFWTGFAWILLFWGMAHSMSLKAKSPAETFSTIVAHIILLFLMSPQVLS